MRYTKLLTALLLACATLTACEDEGGLENVFDPQTYDVQGKVEKGPFVSGSTLSIQPMDESLQVLGSLYNTTIVDNMGNFMVGSKEFTTPYAELMATGYFFNEVEGVLSQGTLTLRAIVDLSNSRTVNVNVLTHLKYARIKNLVAAGKSFTEANNTTQKELFKAFALERFANKEVSSFFITAGTDEAGALIAISSLLLVDRSEAELTEYLAKLCEDFGKDGLFSNEIKTQIEEDKLKLVDRLPNIKENIIERYKDLGIEVTVKDLSNYIDWNNDGVAGNETLKENENVTLDLTTIDVPNEGGSYTITITSPITVYLTPQLEGGPNNDMPSSNTDVNYIAQGLYEGYDGTVSDNNGISYQAEIIDKTLNITVGELLSNSDKSTAIMLYDYAGNIVATVTINQAGKGLDVPDITTTPLLGETGKQVVSAIALKLATGLSQYNLIEQYYAYNKELDLVNKEVSPTAYCIANAWSDLYGAGTTLFTLRNADENSLNVYADYCNTLSAIIYSNLVYGWGDVPYIRKYYELEDLKTSGLPRTDANEILAELENNLRDALERLPEKRNESAKDINGFFFVSKDVARALLANIYLYTSRYHEAEQMLREIIAGGFYKFETSAPYENLNRINATSNEVIFALLLENGMATRSDITIEQPQVIPYLTLTDVMLSLAECDYMLGKQAEAIEYIAQVKNAKGITTSEDNILQQIKSLREQTLLYSGTYFAFLKRTGLAKDVCGIEDYRLLLSIPLRELEVNMYLMQNPGY